MVMNPMQMLSPKQQKLLQQVQQYTKDIKAVVIQTPGEITVRLETVNKEAEKFIPQIQDGIINSIAQSLHIMFNIEGRVEKSAIEKGGQIE